MDQGSSARNEVEHSPISVSQPKSAVMATLGSKQPFATI